MKRITYLLLAGISCLFIGPYANARGTKTEKQPVNNTNLIATTRLKNLYEKINGGLLWYCSSCDDKRTALLNYIAHSDTVGLQPADYLGQSGLQYRKSPGRDGASLQKADEELSKIALRFCADLYIGAGLDHLVSFDEVSPKYADADAAFLIQSLSKVSDADELTDMLTGLQPQTKHYNLLKRALAQLPSSEVDKRNAVIMSMNYYRWMRHFQLDSYIVVNIPAATLRFYKNRKLALQMRAVVGTSDSRTPRLASNIRDISLYPYWNMPRSIMDNEWLDLIKDNRAYLDYHELQIIDSRDSVVPYERVNWKSVSTKNFPFRIRQKTGCANPLGVVKFGMNNPFDVYLHDTPGKGAFGGENRFYSHGCVRVEDAVALADAILPGRVDSHYLSACFTDQKPQLLQVPNPVPVFIVYMLADVDDSGQVVYHQDMYGLLRK